MYMHFKNKNISETFIFIKYQKVHWQHSRMYLVKKKIVKSFLKVVQEVNGM